MQDLAVDIKITQTEQSRLPQIDFNDIPFGKHYSDHMFVADYKDGKWQDLRIVPYSDFSLSPTTSALHYGQAIFEGLKAFRNEKNPKEVLVFRPEDNALRLNESAKRMCMPELPTEIFMQGLHKLLDLDRKWVPDTQGSSLYIRPFMFATDAFLGMRPSNTYTFAIVTGPAGVYYSKPVNVKVEKEYSRTCAGGTGFAKVAGNYAASLLPAKLAAEQGYDQLLWTDSSEHKYIEESGTMNVMFQINDTIVTAPTVPVEDTILRSITRLSVLEILEGMGLKVEERRVSVAEIIEAAKNGTLKDAFGTGTAVTIAPIASIGNDGEKLELPPVESRTVSAKVKETLQGIQRGLIEDTKGWVYRI
ncbi:branched-chain amino acid aminotransferase [Limibacter armeniacum]|uniref:branched-chain amino acid aminotransferase n=1 Tax=Limibacter armeniacum TaxID=466084 RepID=UPI002FE5A8C1